MTARTIVSVLGAACLSTLVLSGCDSGTPAPQPDAAAADKSKEDADLEARLEARKKERLAKAEEEKRKQEEIAQKIVEITVIPDDAKIPKKAAEACEEVVEAQQGFMKKFHPQVEDAALTTQLGMLRKQCNEMNDPKVAICQKYALDATTDDLKGSINEYLPKCMEKYGGQG